MLKTQRRSIDVSGTEQIIGRLRSGKTVTPISGGESYNQWIAEELGGPILKRYELASAVEQVAQPITMKTDTRDIRRSGGFNNIKRINKGGAYPESNAVNDTVRLTAEKIGGLARFAEEDLADIDENLVSEKQIEAAGVLATTLDNAVLGTSVVKDDIDDGNVPFNSVYYMLTTNSTGTPPDGTYTANDNRLTNTGALTYAELTPLLAKVEGSRWASMQNMVWIAHPYFKGILRGMVDGNGRPILLEADRSSAAAGIPDMVLGYPLKWSYGAANTTEMSGDPTGAGVHPLLFVGDGKRLLLGNRAGMEYKVSGGDAAFETDEVLMKVRTRKGFAMAYRKSWAVMEQTDVTL